MIGSLRYKRLVPLVMVLFILTPLGSPLANPASNDTPEPTSSTSESSTVKTTKKSKSSKPAKKLPKSVFKGVQWTDLMPMDDLEAILNPPSYVTDVEDGSEEDQISSQIQSAIAAANDDRYQQALSSTRVVEEMNGKAIKLPGYIVPLEFDDDQTITQFFLVPFFGACIHVPPPPPNQIILVNYPEGLTLNALYDPFWIYGILATTLTENDLATAAYSLNMHHHEVYED